MKDATVNANDIALLEQPFIKVPLNKLKTNLRTTQRNIERDFQQAQSSVNALNKPGVSRAQALETVEGVITRMRGLKRKLSDTSDSNSQTIQATQDRLRHLQDLQALSSFATPDYRSWANVRLDRQLVDYMLRQGYFESAERLAAEHHIKGLVDIELYKECARIEAALEQRSVAEALNWCKENQNGLKRMKSTIEFDLRYQEFIELARTPGKAEKAIAHSTKYLVPWQSTHMPQIRQAMALLAFSPDTECPPYKVLFDEGRWKTLRTKFRYTLLSLFSLPSLPMLSLALHTGLAVMKTPSCFSSQPMSSNINCPTCSSDLGKLAADKSVPWAHHVHSTIVCKITGKVLEDGDEGREPVALPNGRVYSKEALEKMAAERHKIRCPRTGDTYGLADVLKVFLA